MTLSLDWHDWVPTELHKHVPVGWSVGLAPLQTNSEERDADIRLAQRPEPVIFIPWSRWTELESIAGDHGGDLRGGRVRVLIDPITIEDPVILRLREDERAVVYEEVATTANGGILLAWPD